MFVEKDYHSGTNNIMISLHFTSIFNLTSRQELNIETILCALSPQSLPKQFNSDNDISHRATVHIYSGDRLLQSNGRLCRVFYDPHLFCRSKPARSNTSARPMKRAEYGCPSTVHGRRSLSPEVQRFPWTCLADTPAGQPTIASNPISVS